MAILISFLNLLLYIAIVILIAFGIRWLITGLLGWSIDANVEKWGRVVVALICVIAIVIWLSGVLGGGTGLPLFWRYG
jgi:uncharacterized membrane protein (DUF485 family)